MCRGCRQGLDGKVVTLDRDNRPHCSRCYDTQHAVICSRCRLPIAPKKGQSKAGRIRAMDKVKICTLGHCFMSYIVKFLSLDLLLFIRTVAGLPPGLLPVRGLPGGAEPRDPRPGVLVLYQSPLCTALQNCCPGLSGTTCSATPATGGASPSPRWSPTDSARLLHFTYIMHKLIKTFTHHPQSALQNQTT